MIQERIYRVINGPHVSEKSTVSNEISNQIVFKVAKNATKNEVRNAVEKLFSVKVKKVQVLNVKGKLKRNKHGFSKKSDWKKAYVRLEDGQALDLELVD